ncbi:MAG: nucleoside triphosphate pyrophosphohydrolase [Gammaproteobacteria bacterium]|nr:MAG: nucleoside triphosphate pyrophosphohydrolase [Gammaproteobacteria bacterium]
MSDPCTAIQALLDLMARLRDPERGCPWDRAQTWRSLVPYTLEEAYEVADAVEQGQVAELREELGDLLFQIVFYSRIAEEQGHFDFADVAEGITDKMQRRHPHVFGDVIHADHEGLRRAWEASKAEERSRKAMQDESQVAGIARALPALVRAHKLQKRARDVGFDWPDARGALEKTREELREVEEAAAGGDSAHLAEELGDLLFAVVNLVRLFGHSSEQLLRAANDKFERRFRAMEQELAAAGHDDLSQLELGQLETAWSRVKEKEQDAGEG